MSDRTSPLSPRSPANGDVTMSPVPAAETNGEDTNANANGGDQLDPAAPSKPAPRVVVISNLTRSVGESHLRTIFGFYGEVVRVDISTYAKSGTNKGKAALEFALAKEAALAVDHMNSGQLDGATVHVELSSVPIPRSPPHPNPARLRRDRDRDRDRSLSPLPRGGRRGYGSAAGGGGRGGRRERDSYVPRRSRSRTPIKNRDRSRSPRSRSPLPRRRSRSPAYGRGGGGGRSGYPRRASPPRYSRRDRSLTPVKNEDAKDALPNTRSRPARDYPRSTRRSYTPPLRSPSRTPSRSPRSYYTRSPSPRSRSRTPLSRTPSRSRSPRSYTRSPTRSYTRSPDRDRRSYDSRSPTPRSDRDRSVSRGRTRSRTPSEKGKGRSRS